MKYNLSNYNVSMKNSSLMGKGTLKKPMNYDFKEHDVFTTNNLEKMDFLNN